MTYRMQKKLFGSSVDVIYNCPHCGEELVSPLHEVSETHACPACGGEFVVPGPDPVPESVEKPTLGNPWSARNLLLAALGLFLLAFAAEVTRDLTLRFFRDGLSPGTVSERPPEFSVPEQPLPYNGEKQIFDSREAVAPFEIRTASRSNYLVKLVNLQTARECLTVFVHGGMTAEVEVPVGQYEVRYASGNKWYGYLGHFGPDASCRKADEPFLFYFVGNTLMGNSITLYPVANGNLQTSDIPSELF